MQQARGNIEQAFVVAEEAAEVALRFGLASDLRWYRGVRPGTQYTRGRWDEALAGADEVITEVEAGSPHYAAAWCWATRAQVRLGRDDMPGALRDVEQALEHTRLTTDPQMLYFTFATCAYVFHESGDTERAGRLADDFLAQVRDTGGIGQAVDSLHLLAWTLRGLGRDEQLIDVLPTSDVPWVEAARAFAMGDLGGAADTCAGMGALSEEARDRLWLAETLVEKKVDVAAAEQLHPALAFYRSVGATRYIRQAESLRPSTE